VLAGYCHDLNGQLTNAFGWLSLLGPAVAAPDGPAEHLQSSLERMEALLRELRWLVRDPTPTPDPTSLADLLEAWESALRQHPRFHDVAIERIAPTDLPAVSIDFASALRVLLLAADAAAPGDAVDAVTLEIAAGAEHVGLTVSSATDPEVTPAGDSRTTERAGSRATLSIEAREAGFGVDWIDGAVRLRVPTAG
jgi:signal transduction histidine kinase